MVELLQWPAMIATVIATYLVASSTKARRNASFWWYLGSNILWVAWGVHDHADALIVLQVCLAALNLRGVLKTQDEDRSDQRERAERNQTSLGD